MLRRKCEGQRDGVKDRKRAGKRKAQRGGGQGGREGDAKTAMMKRVINGKTDMRDRNKQESVKRSREEGGRERSLRERESTISKRQTSRDF